MAYTIKSWTPAIHHRMGFVEPRRDCLSAPHPPDVLHNRIDTKRGYAYILVHVLSIIFDLSRFSRNKRDQVMDEGTFLAKISELTETDLSELSLSTKLTELSIWDSMAAAAFVAFAAEFGKDDLVSGIQSAQTVGDMFELIPAAVEPS